MKYAVISTGGGQFKVSEGEVVEIPKLPGVSKDKLVFDQVLLVADDKKIHLGRPLIKTAKVTAQIVDQVKAKKIRVVKFKAKSRYRRVRGHRQQLSLVKIVKIVV